MNGDATLQPLELNCYCTNFLILEHYARLNQRLVGLDWIQDFRIKSLEIVTLNHIQS